MKYHSLGLALSLLLPAALPAQLPVTGFPAGAVAVAGVVLVLAGIALVARARAGSALSS